MLCGKQVILRPYRRDDLGEIYELTKNIALAGDHFSIRIPTGRDLYKRFDEHGFWGADHGGLLISDLEGRLLGNVGFFKSSSILDGYEVGYRIYRPQDRSKGVMGEALRIFCAYLFALKPIPRLQISTLPDNIGSRRVAEKCGFRHEGTLRGSFFFRGEYLDTEVYGLLREECPTLDEVL